MLNKPGKLNALDWALRISLSLVFTSIGVEKYTDPMWTKLFAEIGFGQWFRYFTGSVQIAGAILLLIPLLARAGVVILNCTMLGAIIVHLFILPTGIGGAIIPAFLFALISVAWVERGTAGSKEQQRLLQLE